MEIGKLTPLPVYPCLSPLPRHFALFGEKRKELKEERKVLADFEGISQGLRAIIKEDIPCLFVGIKEKY